MVRAGAGALIALDVDGTLLHEDGWVSNRVRDAVTAAVERGHEVMLATGRSAAMTIPVLDDLGISPEFVVCSNGAVTLQRDPEQPGGYTPAYVETFSPAVVLTTIHDALPAARYAVEDAEGRFFHTSEFPVRALGDSNAPATFAELLQVEATRVVVISPDHGTEEFLGLVDRIGLHQVSYSVGWTAWLDIAPDGVNKATALERVRALLGIPIDRLVAVGDGRNDIEMLAWAGTEGAGIAMGQAPLEVREAATAVTGTIAEDGLAAVLDALP